LAQTWRSALVSCLETGWAIAPSPRRAQGELVDAEEAGRELKRLHHERRFEEGRAVVVERQARAAQKLAHDGGVIARAEYAFDRRPHDDSGRACLK